MRSAGPPGMSARSSLAPGLNDGIPGWGESGTACSPGGSSCFGAHRRPVPAGTRADRTAPGASPGGPTRRCVFVAASGRGGRSRDCRRAAARCPASGELAAGDDVAGLSPAPDRRGAGIVLVRLIWRAHDAVCRWTAGSSHRVPRQGGGGIQVNCPPRISHGGDGVPLWIVAHPAATPLQRSAEVGCSRATAAVGTDPTDAECAARRAVTSGRPETQGIRRRRAGPRPRSGRRAAWRSRV